MLKTPRLILDEFRPNDFEVFLRLQTEPRAREFLGGPVEYLKVKNKFEEILAKHSSAKYWAIRSANADFVGLVSLTEHHDKQDIELSYQFLPDFWGQGFAFEALTAILSYARNDLKYAFLVAETQQNNVRSRKLLDKLKMLPLRSLERFGEMQVVYGISLTT